MNIYLDLFDLTAEKEYLDETQRYAGKAIDELRRNGMIAM